MDIGFRPRLVDRLHTEGVSSTASLEAKTRSQPIWLHLITIFFSKRMFYSALKYGIAGGIMLHYHARLGLCLLMLTAFVDYV